MNDQEFIAKQIAESRPPVLAIPGKGYTFFWWAFTAWIAVLIVLTGYTLSKKSTSASAYPPITERPGPALPAATATPRPAWTPLILNPRAQPAKPSSTARPVDSSWQPPSGELRTFAARNRVATMTVKTTAGADYLVRLYEADRMIMSVYIRGGQTESFKVPLGTFEVKFAQGTQWQDYWHLFGSETLYMKLSDTFSFRPGVGWSVTLYEVPAGNINITPIPASEF